MNVSELKEIAPLADVYELNPDGRYIIFLDDRQFHEEGIRALIRAVPNAVIFAVRGDTPKMFEVSE